MESIPNLTICQPFQKRFTHPLKLLTVKNDNFMTRGEWKEKKMIKIQSHPVPMPFQTPILNQISYHDPHFADEVI